MEKIKRYRGCLLGGAAGDALGYQVEFDKLSEIRRRFGEGGVRSMGPHISDDTQMTLFTAEGMLMGKKHGMPMPACVYQSYLDWYRTQRPGAKGGAFAAESALLRVPALHAGRAPGFTCLTALGSGDMGTMEEPINDSKGCGGVMRAAPCGMLKMPDLPESDEVYACQGAMAAAITHGHFMGYVPAAMLADIIHNILLDDGRTLQSIIFGSLRRMVRLFTPELAGKEMHPERVENPTPWTEQMHRFIQQMMLAMSAVEESWLPEQVFDFLGEGWVGDEALIIAVYCVLKYQDSMADCLSAAVTHNGDSDSTGAIAGNILGAWLGEDAIPADWLEKLEMRDVISDMAERLYEAAQAE